MVRDVLLFVLCLHSFTLDHHLATAQLLAPMAYNNNREWDKGKDAWNQSAAWSEPRANVRPREDDYHGEGKRRKFNTGVRHFQLLSEFW